MTDDIRENVVVDGHDVADDVHEVVEEIKPQIFDVDHINEFRNYLAQELMEKPQVFNSILNFTNSTASRTQEISAELEKRDHVLKDMETKLHETQAQLKESQQFARTLMANVNFEGFAKAPEAVAPPTARDIVKQTFDKVQSEQNEWGY